MRATDKHKPKPPDWRTFEEAVARFAKAIAPDAVVRHDVRIPDVDTGNPRQRDVWIEATIGQLFPVRIFVSCKRLRRPLNEQDIDAFIGELRSSGAHKGVVFAKSGFSKPALLKAERLGISCCRLFESEPAQLPRSLVLQTFFCTPRISLRWETLPPPEWSLNSFSELFAIELEEDGRKYNVDHCIAETAARLDAEAKHRIGVQQALPKDIVRVLGVRDEEKGYGEWRLQIALFWRVFQAKLAATLLNGAYSFTADKFVGEQLTPWLALHEDHPGGDWEELVERPDTHGTFGITVFRGLADVTTLTTRLHEQLGPKRLDEIPVIGAV